MAKNKQYEVVSTIGRWAFVAGVIIALSFGAFGQVTNVAWLLVLIGLIVGFVNVSEEEVTPFLMSGAVLIIAASMGGDAMRSIGQLDNIWQALLAVFVPATIIVAIKNVFTLAKH